MKKLLQFLALVICSGLIVSMALAIRRWPLFGLLIALAPVGALFLGLATWMAIDYLRFKI